MKASLFAFVLLFSSLSLAIPIPQLFEELKESGANYAVVGMVCEKVAIIELERTYAPSNYDIINGIVYSDSNRTIGELDVVIIDKKTKDVVLVGEVKCWKDMAGGLSKALDQRKRFKKNIDNRINLIDGDRRHYSTEQFKHNPKFVAIAQSGSKSVGFDLELENSLNDLMSLRQQLMDCQERGECPKK